MILKNIVTAISHELKLPVKFVTDNEIAINGIRIYVSGHFVRTEKFSHRYYGTFQFLSVLNENGVLRLNKSGMLEILKLYDELTY